MIAHGQWRIGRFPNGEATRKLERSSYAAAFRQGQYRNEPVAREIVLTFLSDIRTESIRTGTKRAFLV